MPRSLDARHDRFVLKSPFRISRGIKTAADVVTVTICEGGFTGKGEGVPYPRYGESVESALEAIETMRSAIEAGMTRDQLMEQIPAGAARNALDCALWDLEARQKGRSIADQIGGDDKAPVATALTVVIDSPDAMAASAATMADAPLVKVKVDASDPETQLRAVRAAAPLPKLIVDPNESWNEAITRALQPLMAELRVDLLEQPVSAEDDGWLESFTPLVPICADEAIHTVADLDRVASRYQAINIKLDKTGGLTAALVLAAAARERGLGVMTGCMICSSLSIAPALYIARRSDFADLDGPLWLAEDRAGGVSAAQGVLAPPRPGFWGSL